MCQFTGINQYAGAIPDLRACCNDAAMNAALAAGAGLQVRAFYDEHCSLEAFVGGYTLAATQLKAGDVFVAGHSGHGTETKDDEALVFPDGSLLTGKARHNLLAAFDPGVLLVIEDDSCHAAGTIRGGEAPSAEHRVRRVVDVKSGYIVRAEGTREIRASMIHFAACRALQTSGEDDKNGYWTGAKHNQYLSGITWRQWFDATAAEVTRRNPMQEPQLTAFGPRSDVLDRPAWTFV